MGFPFAAVASAVLPELVGGIVGNNSSNKARKQFVRDRNWDWERTLEIRSKDRRLAAGRLKDERRYSAQQLAADRKYAAGQLAGDRRYAERRLADDRLYARQQTGSERSYAGALRRQGRHDALVDENRQVSRFVADRASQQALADRQAERAAATRGIDFQRVRDDAVRAGFNPLTALGFAGNYSTEVGYGLAGAPLAFGGGGGGGGYAGSSVSAGPGAVPGSSMIGSSPVSSAAAPSSAYVSAGGGYGGYPAPAFDSGAVAANLVSHGLDAYFNAVDEQDQATYDNIVRQVASGHLARMLASQNPYQDYGFKAPKQTAYQPHVGVSAGSGAFDPMDQFPVDGWFAPAGDTDPVTNLPIDREPMTEGPLFKRVNLGGGGFGWAINSDVAEGEVIENLSSGAVLAQAGLYHGAKAIRPSVVRADQWLYDLAFPAGQSSYQILGSKPVQNVFGGYDRKRPGNY